MTINATKSFPLLIPLIDRVLTRCHSEMSKANRLAIPAVRQIMAKLAKGEKEEEELVEKIEDSCLRFDHDKKGVRIYILEFHKVCETIYKFFNHGRKRDV